MKSPVHSTDDRRTMRDTARRFVTRFPQSRRAGVTLMEAVLAFVIVGAAMATLAQSMWLTRQQMRVVERHFVATQELANVMERLALVPFDQLTDDRSPKFEPSPELLQVAQRAKITLEVSDVAGPPAGKRLRAKVSWPTPAALAREATAQDDSSPSADKKPADSARVAAEEQETFELVTFRFSSGGTK